MILSLKNFFLLNVFALFCLIEFSSHSFALSYIDTKTFIEELKIRIENTNNIKSDDLFIEWNDYKIWKFV